MDSVVFDGVTYVKASIAAKNFRYTSDYIGQLCRAKKVDARLVGRTWFVNLDSIKEHKQNKFKLVEKEEETLNIPIKIKTPRVVARPTVNAKTIRILTEAADKHNLVQNFRVSYEKDEQALLPKLTEKHTRTPKTVRIQLSSTKKLTLSNNKKNILPLQTDKLSDTVPSINFKNNILSEEKTPKEEIKTPDISHTNIIISSKQDNEIIDNAKEISITTTTTANDFKEKKLNSNVVSKNNLDKHKVKPKTSLNLQSASTLVVAKSVQNQQISRLILMSPLLFTFLAIASAVLIFSASATLVVFDSLHESRIVFEISNLLYILQNII